MGIKPLYILKVSKWGTTIVNTFYSEPKLGTYASYLLMKRELWMAAANWHLSDPVKWEQLQFNQNFLREMLKKHGELHCEYCGQSNLTLKEYNHIRRSDELIATADHFIPKSLDLAKYGRDLDNLIVCCEDCNRRKADKIWDVTTLKYKYASEKRDEVL